MKLECKSKFVFSIILALISLRAFSFDIPIKEFETDFCTMFPDGNENRKECCIEHDIYYWLAGHKSLMDKSDLRLRSCVRTSGSWVIADIMYYGVRAGHYSPIQNKYKWGWAQKPGMNEKKIDPNTLENILSHLKDKGISQETLKNVKKFYSSN